MKKSSFIPFVCLVVALGIYQVQNLKIFYRADEFSERVPAAIPSTCMGLVASFNQNKFAIPTEVKLKEFFDELTDKGSLDYWDLIKTIETKYTTTNVDKSIPATGLGALRSITVGKILLERLRLNEYTARVLVRFGYRAEQGYLVPPRDLPKLYSKIYQEIFYAAKAAGIEESDIIFPALQFKKGDEVLFIRPGLDPLPNGEGWEMVDTSKELSVELFGKMIKEKKMLLSPSMFFHDIGHIVDYIENPQYMKAYSFFQEKKLKALEYKSIHRDILTAIHYGAVIIRGDMERYFNEWLYLPSPKNYEKIKKILTDIDLAHPKTEVEFQLLYSRKSKNELLQKADLALKERYTLFSSHGGGARDWSADRYLENSQLMQGYDHVSEGNPSVYNFFDKISNEHTIKAGWTTDFAYRLNEAPGFFYGIQYLVDYKKGKALPVGILDAFMRRASLKKMSIEDYTDDLLSKYMAQMSFRIQSAMKFKITPDQIAYDMAKLYEPKGWEEYRKTPTFLYYSTYPEKTIQWAFGVEIAREFQP